MPIRKDLRHLYDNPEWRALRWRILARAKNSCEFCRMPNMDVVVLTQNGTWRRDVTEGWINSAGKSVPEPKGRQYVFHCVLAISHLNHVAGDNRDENLAALCQRCHLIHDAPQHRESRAKTMRERKNNLELPWTDNTGTTCH